MPGSTILTNGAPNNILINFNPLAIVITIPILTYGIYPLLRKRNIKFGRITRITLGFILASISSALGAVLQYYVYETNPCKYAATRCANDGAGVSPISIWTQVSGTSQAREQTQARRKTQDADGKSGFRSQSWFSARCPSASAT